MSAPEVHRYGDQRSQFGELTLPDGPPRGPYPVAVLLHGGFWRSRYSLSPERPVALDLARRGWAAWNLEYRRVGALSRGGWPATFEDVATGVDALAGLDAPLDLGRMVVIGHSAGGHLALWAAARPGLPDGAPGAGPRVRPAAGVAQAGIVDLRHAHRLGLGQGAVARLLGGAPDGDEARYDLASPIERLPFGIPQLLVHGDADRVVPVELAHRYARRAAEAGERCDLAVLAGCGHMEHLDPGSIAWRTVVDWLGRV